jgi:predicted N-formylglutamate amidohydrolase
VAALLEARAARPTMLLAIHSFTPTLGGEARPWHAGIACGADRRLADPLIRALRQHSELCIGDNRPYGVDHIHDYTLPTHGEFRGIPHVMIEIRQDQLASAADIDAWVNRLADAVTKADAETEGIGHAPGPYRSKARR